jgi:Leucine-rich repeat (LRR) protein
VVAGFIRSEEDKQKAFRIVIEDKKHLKGQAFGDIERYVFAYDGLPERCKDPFLDICVFFKGMNWDSVADILGESELDMLEKRALVSKDRSMTLSVHDVILKIGSKRAEETRFNFTIANRFKFELFLEKDIPGIKGLWYDVYENLQNPSYIPAIKLDSMSNSLKILRLGSLKVKGKCDKRFEKLVFFQGKVPHLPFNISQMPSNLKHMELRGEGHYSEFEISSNDLQQLRNLRILRLIRFAGLEKLPEELGEILHELRELTLSCCTSIEELPGSIANLQKLRKLRIDHCDNLRRLPEDFGLLNSLQVLDLSFCKNLSRDLKDLPKDFQKFEKLNPFNRSLDEVEINMLEAMNRYRLRNLKS